MPSIKNIEEKIKRTLHHNQHIFLRDTLKVHPDDYQSYVLSRGTNVFVYTYPWDGKKHRINIRLYPLGSPAPSDFTRPYYAYLRWLDAQNKLEKKDRVKRTVSDIRKMCGNAIHAIDRTSGEKPKALLLHRDDYDLYKKETGRTTYFDTKLYKHQ